MVTFAISVISYLYIDYTKTYIKKSSLEYIDSIGSITENKVELYVEQMQDKIKLFNSRMYLYSKLIEYNQDKSPKTQKIIKKILDFPYLNDKEILDIVVLDMDGLVIASKLSSITQENPFIKTTKETLPHNKQAKILFKNDKIAPLLYLSAPVLQGDKLIGTSVFIIKLDHLNKLLINKNIGTSGEIFMGTKSGTKLMIFTPMKEKTYPFHCKNEFFNKYISMQNILPTDKHKIFEEALDYRKVPVVLSLHYNETLKAFIVVKKDMAELMEPIRKIINYQLSILIISIIFIIIASLLISNNIIKVIKTIVRITSNISNGNLEERIQISTKNELGELAESVNKMADFMVNRHAITKEEVVKKTKELQKISSQLEESNLELAKNNKNLNTIIQSLSHDIKTPLTIINGYLEELDDGLVTCDELPKVTAILKKETAYLNELATEVIGYIQSKEITVNKQENIQLKEFLIAEVFPLLRVGDGVKLTCELDEEFTIKFNRTALKKILINLLHNASKYTKDGYITTKVINNEVIIQDTGIGIDPQYSQMIFEPFFGLDESRNRENNGFGLGLSIASNLAKNNGYKLKLDTSYIDGCRFIIKS